ncbi:peptide/nickel transport system permease protein [Rhizobium azooxidifex]|uniref:Peptide/nickel transport system permease protein n=1 Tax=Mycoplana azooxidifex TaxID=1636188 RepID=A0A7W6D5Z9_9HYPH|nr:ABC transporter permease [Mycoplana azooxidifex]MBB3976687.1 peptide/nickel transport system permease protein [Mycoplana azooxidifex]
MPILRKLLRTPAGAIGLLMLAVTLAATLMTPILSPYDPLALDFAAAMQPPSTAHWFGTDNFGRDIFTRILAGAVFDLRLALVCVFGPMIMGVMIGLVAGFYGGIVDAALMRLTDIVWAFPFYVLILAIVGVLGPSEANLYIAFFIVNWIGYARIVRGETLLVSRLEFIEATRVLRFGKPRVMLRHILPNVVTPAVVYSMSDVVLTVQAVAAMSFFGLGVQPPAPEWGLLIVESIDYMREAPWMAIFPGLAIVWIGIAFSLLGEGLATALKPKG